MLLRRPALLVAAALVGVALVVPAAEAGAGDVAAIRTVAARYSLATTNGSPEACQLATPNVQQTLAYFASGLLKTTKLMSCPAAVKALAKYNASKYPGGRQAYVRSGEAAARAIARGKVTIHGTKATLEYTLLVQDTQGKSSLSFSSEVYVALVHGRWLIDTG